MILVILLLGGCPATVDFPADTADEPCAWVGAVDTDTPRMRSEDRDTSDGTLCGLAAP